MSKTRDPFEVFFVEEEGARPAEAGAEPAAWARALPGAACGRLHGFDLDDRPLLAGLAELPGEIVPARTTVPLRRSEIGAGVVVLFERGGARLPIVVGVLRGNAPPPDPPASAPRVVSVEADEERLVLSAERQVTLRCGEASITLTRAGKVIIEGTYVVSRSSGYNKIKGAAVDIN